MSHFLLMMWGLVDVDLIVSLDDFDDDDDPETTIHVRLMAWCNVYEQRQAGEKQIGKKLMAAACHPTKWWDWFMS